MAISALLSACAQAPQPSAASPPVGDAALPDSGTQRTPPTATTTPVAAGSPAASPRALPTATLQPSPTSTLIPATRTISPTGTPPPPVTTAHTLAPVTPLEDTEIVDRPLRNVRAVTDGERKYRIAAWGPVDPFVALIPQDGPGMDIANVETGEVTAVVTDSYVLEPVWTGEGTLVVHRVAGDQDTLTLFDPGSGFRGSPLVSGPPLRAPSFGAGMLAYAAEGEVRVCEMPCSTPVAALAGGALVTALSPDGSMLAWTPEVANLEEVETLAAHVGEGQTSPDVVAWPLSLRGEGLWLPRWSSDGSRIVLTGIGGRLVVATADGSARYDLGPGDSPVWSPDGTRIAFAGASAGLEYTTRDLHIIRADGKGGRLRLTDAGEEEFYVSPSWSPDGRRLAFVELDSGRLFVGDVP